MLLLAGVSVRAILESAVKAGFPVAALDYFADWDAERLGRIYGLTRDFGLEPTPHNLLKAAKSISCTDFVYSSGLEHQPDELAYWLEKGLLRGNTPQTLKKIRHPWRLQQVLAEVGLNMPAFYRLEEWLRETAFPTEQVFLLKPLSSGGGKGIVILPKERDQAESLLGKIENPAQYLIQAYVEGMPASVTFLADGQRAMVVGTSRQLILTDKGGFTYAGSIIPLSPHAVRQVPHLEGLLEKATKQLAERCQLSGLNTLDFILSAEGPWVLEVNPRWSGSVELWEKRLNLSLLPYHIAPHKALGPAEEAGSLGQRLTMAQRNGFWGRYIVYASATFKVASDLELPPLLEWGMRDVPHPGTVVQQGQPICTVFAQADSEEKCLAGLREKAGWAVRVLRESPLEPGLSLDA